MKYFAILCLLSSFSFAQETEGLTADQQRLYSEITASVAAPCCSNAIPVAFHESGMALYIRDEVKKSILAGKSRKEIFTELGEMRLGSDNREVIFTIPETNSLGILTWLLPFITLALGIVGIFYFLKRARSEHQETQKISDQELIEQFRPYILKRLEQLD